MGRPSHSMTEHVLSASYMNLVEEIGERLLDRNLTVVSRETGISRSTLTELKKGRDPDYLCTPDFRTMNIMLDYLDIECVVKNSLAKKRDVAGWWHNDR